MPGLRGSLLAVGVVIATIVGAAGIAADAASASAAQAVSLGYTCAFPGGTYWVGVEIAATVAWGARIGPVSLLVTTVLPRAALATHSGPVRAADLLTVTEASSSAKPVMVTWPTSVTSSVPLTGELPLRTSGTIPATVARRPGVVTFTAGRLGMVLYFGKGATVRASCTPVGGAATFATQTVTAAARPAKSKFPPGCGHIKRKGNGVPTCGYITGYSDVAKLIGAALLQPPKPAKPGLVNVDLGEFHKFKPGKLVVYSTGQLFYRSRHVLPPVTATFLAFGFVPVSATLHLTELKPISIVSVSGILSLPYPIVVTATTKISIRVSGVRVNGVPLAVGAGCRTRSPVTLTLVGHGKNTSPPRGYTLPTGGALSGEVTIPPFIDCGVTENLDPLFTGSISGRGNFVKLTQGRLCAPSQPQNYVCPPPVPKPQH
jgi:hypothetical protein